MKKKEKLYLNPDLVFFNYNDRRYGYLASYPYPFSFVLVSPSMERALKMNVNGKGLQNVIQNKFDTNQFDNFRQELKDIGLLVPKKETRYIKNSIEESREMRRLWIFPTNYCNLKCSYCYANAGTKPKKNN